MSSVIPPAVKISARFAAVLLDYLRSTGTDPGRLYPPPRVSEIDASGVGTRIALAEWLAMLDTAIAATGDADLALKSGAHMKPRHLGVLGYVYTSCSTLADVNLQSARYLRLVHGMADTQPIIRGGTVETPLHWPDRDGPPPAVAQFRLASRASMARWLTGRFDLPMDAYFQFPRDHGMASFKTVFGGRLHFSQPQTRLVHPAAYLDLPVLMADTEMRRTARNEAEALLQELSGEPDFLRELKTVLTQSLAVGRGSLVHAAEALHISTRTLHRRLEHYDRSFQQVLGEVRQRLAERYLHDSAASLHDVAFLLGYTEQSAFQRAFKRWSGLTPGAYRAGLSMQKDNQGIPCNT